MWMFDIVSYDAAYFCLNETNYLPFSGFFVCLFVCCFVLNLGFDFMHGLFYWSKVPILYLGKFSFFQLFFFFGSFLILVSFS